MSDEKTEKTITEKLDQLAELHARADALRLSYEEQRNALIPEYIRIQLEALDKRFEAEGEQISNQALELEAEVKELVIASGETVRGAHLMAVWNKGRVSWDSRLLDGFLLAHPELEQARKVGEPTCTLRKV